jgi:hypothetical protein
MELMEFTPSKKARPNHIDDYSGSGFGLGSISIEIEICVLYILL